MGKYFGTDGFRGEAGGNLTADHAYKIGRFLGWYYGEMQSGERIATSPAAPRNDGGEGGTAWIATSPAAPRNDGGEGSLGARIVIGKDTRRSSYMFEYALAAGITASGGNAYLLHVTTTPSVAYIVRNEGFQCGVMISASHNVFSDNGIKLLNGNGEKMEEEVLEKIEAYLDYPSVSCADSSPKVNCRKAAREAALGRDKGSLVPFAKGSAIGRTVDYVAGRNRYVGYLISLGMYSFKGLRIGLDCANGAAFSIAPAVFQALGAKVYVIGNDPDGTNINADCGSTHPEALQALVKEKGLDVGFAFDGDADRCLAVDENGELFDGDHILYALGRYMQASPVVTTVMSNLGLYKAFDKLGIAYAKTAVGDKYVYEYMAKNGCALGGEQSGHIIISKYATTGDGILTSLKIMECMLEQKKKLSELKQGLTIFPQVLRSVRVEDKAAAMAQVKGVVEEIERELGENGRILVRASGTEPVIRVMVEADREDRCRECVDRVIKTL